MELHYLTECSSPRLRIYFLTSPKRAYALWQAEGQPDGRHEEHWYYAAREIAAEDRTSSAVKRLTRRKKRKT